MPAKLLEATPSIAGVVHSQSVTIAIDCRLSFELAGSWICLDDVVGQFPSAMGSSASSRPAKGMVFEHGRSKEGLSPRGHHVIGTRTALSQHHQRQACCLSSFLTLLSQSNAVSSRHQFLTHSLSEVFPAYLSSNLAQFKARQPHC